MDLLARTLRALVERSGLDPVLVDDVVGGCVTQVGDQALNLTRSAVRTAGFPESVVRRERYSDHPPRYEYHLTAAGWELCDVLLALMRWGDRHLNAGDPPLRLVHACGEPLDATVVCAACGAPARDGVRGATGRGALPDD